MIVTFLLSSAEKALNKFLQLDSQTNACLSQITGKVIAIELDKMNYCLYFLIRNDQIKLLTKYNEQPDVILTGAPFDLLRLGKLEANSATLFANNIEVTGDVEVAKQFKQVFASLEIDWEEQLSKVTGDLIAHQVGKFVQMLSNWAKKSSQSLQQDIKEYAQEEVQWLPLRLEVEDFLRAVDVTRDDVERLTVRTQKLLDKAAEE